MRARLRGALGHRAVLSLRPWQRDAGRPAISRQGDWVAFDRDTGAARRGLHLASLRTGTERCLTCDLYELRDADVTSPTWHPSGEVIVALVQRLPRRMRLDPIQRSGPERGLHAELWAITVDGRTAWQLSRVTASGSAALDPVFSFEGDQLAWSERVTTQRGGQWGDWRVAVADFTIRRGVPKLGRAAHYEPVPWPGVVTVDSFTLDDGGLLVTTDDPSGTGRRAVQFRLDGDDATTYDELGRSDADRGRFTERAIPAPRGGDRLYASSRGLPEARDLPRRHDLWLEGPVGLKRERLTFFNDPGFNDPGFNDPGSGEGEASRPLGEALIAGTSWSRDVEHLLIHVVTPADGGSDTLWLATLDPELVALPVPAPPAQNP